jgi:hypothetical protein
MYMPINDEYEKRECLVIARNEEEFLNKINGKEISPGMAVIDLRSWFVEKEVKFGLHKTGEKYIRRTYTKKFANQKVMTVCQTIKRGQKWPDSTHVSIKELDVLTDVIL